MTVSFSQEDRRILCDMEYNRQMEQWIREEPKLIHFLKWIRWRKSEPSWDKICAEFGHFKKIPTTNWAPCVVVTKVELIKEESRWQEI